MTAALIASSAWLILCQAFNRLQANIWAEEKIDKDIELEIIEKKIKKQRGF